MIDLFFQSKNEANNNKSAEQDKNNGKGGGVG